MKRGATSQKVKISASQHYDCAKFRELLDECGLTQTGLADLIDTTPGTVSAWATAKRRPPGSVVAYLKLLAKIRSIRS